MDKDFEKKLREKMEQSSLKDIMPDFDKAAAWQELDNKMTEKKRVLPVWFNYAAAVVAGLLLGSTGVKLWWNDTATVVTPTVVVKEVPVANDPIYINTPEPTTPSQQPLKPVTTPITQQYIAKKAAVKQITVIDTQHVVVKVPEQQNVPEKSITVPNEEPLVAHSESVGENAVPIKKKTVHLLDIMNEDRAAVLNDPEMKGDFSNVVRILTPPRGQVENKEDDRQIVIRRLLNN